MILVRGGGEDVGEGWEGVRGGSAQGSLVCTARQWLVIGCGFLCSVFHSLVVQLR